MSVIRVRLRVRFHFSRSRRCTSSASSTGEAQVAVEDRDGGGCDAGNPGGLSERDGTDALQLVLNVARETGNAAVGELGRNGAALGVAEAHYLALLLLDVAAVLDFGFDGCEQAADGLL